MPRQQKVGFGGGNARAAARALFVRIPKAEADKLDRAAFELKRPKQEIVASLIERYVGEDVPSSPPLDKDEVTVGRHSFRAVVPPEVLTPPDLAALLRIEEDLVLALAEHGELPGRKLGDEWRFSRAAVLEWLGSGD